MGVRVLIARSRARLAVMRLRSAVSKSDATPEPSLVRYRSPTTTIRWVRSSSEDRRVLSSAWSDAEVTAGAWPTTGADATRPGNSSVRRYHAGMLARLDVRDARADLAERLGIGLGPSAADAEIAETVSAIVEDVRRRGDVAVREYTRRFDGPLVDQLRVTDAECRAAVDATSVTVRDALELAAERINEYHKLQAAIPPVGYSEAGVTVTEAIRPVDRAGLYVPGGRAAYPSTVLMTSIPARVAGVPERVLCVPPDASGAVSAVPSTTT